MNFMTIFLIYKMGTSDYNIRIEDITMKNKLPLLPFVETVENISLLQFFMKAKSVKIGNHFQMFHVKQSNIT